MLKVLPKELPLDHDIETVKKEEYVFKTDGKDEATVTPVESNDIDSVLPTDSVSKTTTANASEPFMEIISSVDTSNEIEVNPPSPTEGVQIMIIERKDLEKTVTQQAPEELILPALTGADNELRAKEAVTVFSTNAIDDRHDKENLLNLPNGGVLEGSIFQTFHFDDKDSGENDTDEDYSTELVKPPRPTEYTSKQRTMPSSTLLHGKFTSNLCNCATNLKNTSLVSVFESFPRIYLQPGISIVLHRQKQGLQVENQAERGPQHCADYSGSTFKE